VSRWPVAGPSGYTLTSSQQSSKQKYMGDWEVLIAYFPLIRHGPHRKRRLQQLFFSAGSSLQSCYLATIRGYTDSQIPLWCDMDLIENDASNSSSIFAWICCRRNVFTNPLPSNMCIQRHRLMGGIYEVSCSDDLWCHDIHTKFHKDWFRDSKVKWGWYADIQTARWSHKTTSGK
jgi:hypothetical protein